MKKVSLACLLLGCFLASAQAAEEPKRPNVVLILADDLAWDVWGAFGNPEVGSRYRPAGLGGMRFDRAFGAELAMIGDAKKAAAAVFYERYVAARQHPEYLRLKSEHRQRHGGGPA